MRRISQRRTIVMADDDAEDCLLVHDALREANRVCDLQVVRNGEELLDYLDRAASGDRDAPWPDLILVDLKMPRKDGRETIRELKSNPQLPSHSRRGLDDLDGQRRRGFFRTAPA